MTMPDLPWEKLNEIFHAALERHSTDRAAYLDSACGTDKDLRTAVESLLKSHEATHNFVDRPAYEAAAEMLTADGKLKPGDTMGHYRILSHLGEGGMGTVYLAKDTKLHRKVSLKLFPRDAMSDSDRLQRFEQEARVSSALNHPNVMTVHEIGADSGRHFIATEFIDGQTLRERLASPIEIDEAVRIAIEVASALIATHRVHVVHRDIKPENIMIRSDDGLVKVLDFGLAKMSPPHERSSDYLEHETLQLVETAPGVVMGTLHYMSPEQARGDSVDERTDVWSLGVVLFEMIARCKPFIGRTPNETIASILSKTPALPLSRYCPTVPERLQDITAKALTKDREERYQTSKDLLIDLKRFQRSMTEQSEAPPEFKAAETNPIPSASDRASVRYRIPLIVAMAVLLMVAVLVFYWRDRLGIVTGSRPISSIAVLPLVQTDSSADTEFLSEGITEGIISRLSQLPELRVMSHSAVNHYKGQNTDARTIGKDLDVEVVLTGRLMKRDDAVTINMELVDTADNTRLWGEQYDHKVSDLLAVQKEIPIDVLNKLKLRLSGESLARLAKTDTSDSEAYQLYIKGRLAWEKWSVEASRQAVAFFEEAIKKDPNYALAWAGIVDAYLIGPGVGPEVSQREAQQRARNAAERALYLDPDLGEAHIANAGVLLYGDWDFAGAEKEYQHGLKLNPNFAEGHHLYSHLLLILGRWNEAYVESREFLKLDPISRTPLEHLAVNDLYAGNYDHAIEQFRKTLSLYPREEAANYLLLGEAYDQKKMHREAVDSYLEGYGLAGLAPQDILKLRNAFEASGIYGFYRALLEKFKGAPVSKTYFTDAELHARLNEKDVAFRLLEKYYAEHSNVVTLLKQNPGFANLRSDPRYADLLRRIGLPQ